MPVVTSSASSASSSGLCTGLAQVPPKLKQLDDLEDSSGLEDPEAFIWRMLQIDDELRPRLRAFRLSTARHGCAGLLDANPGGAVRARAGRDRRNSRMC